MTRRHCYFNLDEANNLIPTLEHYFREIALMLREMRELQMVLKSGGATLSAQGIHLPRSAPEPVLQARDTYIDCCHAYDAMMGELLHLGVDVVDVEAGVVNFYSWCDGEEVVLSWQFGEPAVQYWIDPVAGQGQRRSLRHLFFDVPGARIAHH